MGMTVYGKLVKKIKNIFGGSVIYMIIVLAIIIGCHLIKDAMDDAEMRGWARSKGYNTYPSRAGMRYTDTNENIMVVRDIMLRSMERSNKLKSKIWF